MRLNDKDVRSNVIKHLEAVCPNKRNLPWDKDLVEIHRYLRTIAEMNRLSHLTSQYQGFEFKHWNIFSPLAEAAIIPSRVVAVANDYAVNLINSKKYEEMSDDYYTVNVEYHERVVDPKTEQSKLVKKLREERRYWDVMTLEEFNMFTLKLIVALKGSPTKDQTTLESVRKEALLANVAEREIVNDCVIGMDTYGLHLNSQSFIKERYAIPAQMSESLTFTTKLAKWAKGE